MVGQIRFRRVPRLLMDRFFSPPAASTAHPTTQSGLDRVLQLKSTAAKKPGVLNAGLPHTSHGAAAPGITTHQKPKEDAASPYSEEQASDDGSSEKTAISTSALSDQDGPDTGVVAQCLQVLARETGLGLESLTPDASFVELGIESLMSLVLSEKFRAELGIEIKSSLFLECPTIGELKAWLEEYC